MATSDGQVPRRVAAETPNEGEQTGASTWVCDYIVAQQLAALRPREVVDFGAGGGKNGRIVRGVFGRDCTLIGIEGFERSARTLRELGIYDRVDAALIQDWVERDSGQYSLAIFGDVIEHLTAREIHRVVTRCLEKFTYVIIVVPLYDIFQDDAYGNPLEVHKAYITSGFFDRYRPIEKHIIESPRFTMMNLLLAVRREQKPLYRRVLGGVFHVGMLTLQPLGLARPAVDLLKRTVGRYKWLLR
jgi:hypothetical protein